jgi:hypothetical protein
MRYQFVRETAAPKLVSSAGKMHKLVAYRRKDGKKVLHGVELNGKKIHEGTTRREAQQVWTNTEADIKKKGHSYKGYTRNWYGKTFDDVDTPIHKD